MISPGPRLAGTRQSPTRSTRVPVFELTGGLHATGLFSSKGEAICAREDIGRHNA
ncbi:MAG: formate dehydrogenase accessory sulfurtransferase FdhD, partial [Thermoleophilia bacterium]|nr:formate dehydrogenase accessory sulfurtransferase FdhD [Thermoleophilia bacterium]